MKPILFLLIATIFSLACFPDTVLAQKTVAMPDSVYIKYANKDIVKESFWDKNSGAIISAIISTIGALLVSLIALWVAFDSLKKQLKVQIETTVDKEWLQSVRVFTSNHRASAEYVVSKQIDLSVTKTRSELEERLFKDEEMKMHTNWVLLQFFLSEKKDPLEKSLLDAVKSLHNKVINTRNISGWNDVKAEFDAVRNAAIALFDSKNPA